MPGVWYPVPESSVLVIHNFFDIFYWVIGVQGGNLEAIFSKRILLETLAFVFPNINGNI